MSAEQVGRVLGIAVRTRKKGPMREVERVKATGDGLDGDVEATTVRAVTFIAAQQWHQVQQELGGAMPWHTRRANVLVEADSLAHLIGRTIRVGDVHVRVNAETKPCELMDELQPGLRAALKPECRGGVYGSVIQEGDIAVGDVVALVS
ncbi:MAG TPA: MOSC domain-containing protein [Phycisphaerae bacterium]|nr:MOSC domain-containing protein [Phycisphaerae bacterium]